MKKQLIMYIGKLGYLARASLYLTIGALAILSLLTVWRADDKALDSKGAIATIAETSFAQPLMVILILGLICYSLWRGIQVLFDADGHGTDTSGLVVRTSLLISAITHGALAYYAYTFLEGTASASSSGGTSSKVAEAMSLPFGRWIVAVIGFLVIGFGISQIVKAFKEKYRKYMTFTSHSQILHKVAKIGLSARAIVFIITGSYVVYAAWTSDPSKSQGMSQAFTFLESLSFGSFLVILMAIGLIFFGLYSASEAIYRKIDMDSPNSYS